MKADLWIVGVLVLCAAAFFLLWPSVKCRPEPVERARARNEAAGLLTAFKYYHKEYNSYPTGTARQVFDQITSNNSLRIPFFDYKASQLNAAGEFCDPWETAYQITIGTTNLTVRSAGADRVFDTKDDIAVP